MRDYVKGLWGIFHEDSDSLGIHLVLRIWRHDQDAFDNVIQQLREDIADAGGDWTGTLVLGPIPRWWCFGKSLENDEPVIEQLLETYFHGTSQASGAFEDVLLDNFAPESPRSEGYNSESEKKARKGSFRGA